MQKTGKSSSLVKCLSGYLLVIINMVFILADEVSQEVPRPPATTVNSSSHMRFQHTDAKR
jgi:hypothetical protein